MNKYLRVGLVLASVACVVMAYHWVVTFDPASPVVPFALMFIAGLVFQQSLD